MSPTPAQRRALDRNRPHAVWSYKHRAWYVTSGPHRGEYAEWVPSLGWGLWLWEPTAYYPKEVV